MVATPGSDAYGNYSISLASGQYTITASSPYGHFSPASIVYDLTTPPGLSAQHRRIIPMLASPDPDPPPAAPRNSVRVAIGSTTVTHWYFPDGKDAGNIQSCWAGSSGGSTTADAHVTTTVSSTGGSNFDATFVVDADATAGGREFYCRYKFRINNADVFQDLDGQDFLDIESVAMKLEQVGPTVISTDGKYSEDTTIRVTAISPATGATILDFVGRVNIGEDGTAIYTQNVDYGASLPPFVDITAGGTATFVARSLASPSVEGGLAGAPPTDARIKTINYPVYQAANLPVPQWIQPEGPGPVYANPDPLAFGPVYYWVQARVKDLFDAVNKPPVSPDLATVLATVNSYTTKAIETAGSTPVNHAAHSPITINPFYTQLRLNTSAYTACGFVTQKAFAGVIFHEARHAYQLAQASLPGNDVDQDYLVNVISIAADDSVPPKNYFVDTVAARSTCNAAGDLVVPGVYHGDNVFDALSNPPYASYALEMDTYAFGAKWGR